MDKIEKIRQEIERLKSQLVRGACAAQTCMETSCKEEAYNEVLAFIDSIEDEPKNVEFEEYLRGVFEINNGVENDVDNLVRLHAPELLRLAKQHEPNIEMKEEKNG